MTVDTRFITPAALYSTRNVAVAIKLEDQKKAEEAYRKLVLRFIADFNRIEWPVAFISKHHDATEITDILMDTLNEKNFWSEQQMRDMAEEIVDG